MMKAVVACLVFALAIHQIAAACDTSKITSDYTSCATSALTDMGKQCNCISTFMSSYASCGDAYKTACESAMETYKKSFTSCDWDKMSCDGTASGAASFGASWLVVLASMAATFWFA